MRVLVVEDNAVLGRGLVALLRGNGYAVDLVADGASALAATEAESFDLVLLDLSLPGMDGLDVLREMRDGGNRSAVLVLTARGALDERVRGLDLGADDYMTKPFEVAELPARELNLLEMLMRRAGKVVSKPAIIQSLTAFDDDLSSNAVEQYVSRLRRKLVPYGLTIRTARGLGYYLDRATE